MTSQEPHTQHIADQDLPDTEVIITAQPAPVFVDSTGRRRRLLRRCAYGFGAFCLVYGGLISLSLTGGPISPNAVVPFPELIEDVGPPHALDPLPTPEAIVRAPKSVLVNEATTRRGNNSETAYEPAPRRAAERPRRVTESSEPTTRMPSPSATKVVEGTPTSTDKPPAPVPTPGVTPTVDPSPSTSHSPADGTGTDPNDADEGDDQDGDEGTDPVDPTPTEGGPGDSDSDSDSDSGSGGTGAGGAGDCLDPTTSPSNRAGLSNEAGPSNEDGLGDDAGTARDVDTAPRVADVVVSGRLGADEDRPTTMDGSGENVQDESVHLLTTGGLLMSGSDAGLSDAGLGAAAGIAAYVSANGWTPATGTGAIGTEKLWDHPESDL